MAPEFRRYGSGANYQRGLMKLSITKFKNYVSKLGASEYIFSSENQSQITGATQLKFETKFNSISFFLNPNSICFGNKNSGMMWINSVCDVFVSGSCDSSKCVFTIRALNLFSGENEKYTFVAR